jgi:hypothetical protein
MMKRLDQVTHILRSRGIKVSSNDRLVMVQTIEVLDSIERDKLVNKVEEPERSVFSKPINWLLALCIFGAYLMFFYTK